MCVREGGRACSMIAQCGLSSMNLCAEENNILCRYVWNQEASGWVPTLVILRLNRAALCVQWSPKGIQLRLKSLSFCMLFFFCFDEVNKFY